MKLGLDFDNTLIDYDAVIQRVVVERGYLPADHGLRSKTEIRDALRRKPEGDLLWQRVQSFIYAEGILEAAPTRELGCLFDFVRNNRVDTWIVSHKTTTAPFDPEQRNLRAAALQWMEQRGFFDPDRLGLSRDRVIFADTFEQKIDRIAALQFDVFVDDLEEVLRHPKFPPTTRRIHFANGSAKDQFNSWEPLVAALGVQLSEEKLRSTLAKLSCAAASTTRVAGGRNSRCFRVADGERELLVKQYFRNTRDPRNRLETEFSAMQFMWSGGLRCIAEPILCDRENHSAAYRWIEGSARLDTPVSEREIDALLAFIAELQRLRTCPAAATLPAASEACFSLEALEANLRARRKRLDGVSDPGLRLFLREQFDPQLDRWTALAKAAWLRAGRPPGREIDPSVRILSPSDVGFHNTLRTADGSLVFVDFEYFGWDDPAKLISDFVLQPEQKLSDALRARFEQGIIQLVGDPELPERYRWLQRLFRLKWVMILLNEFLRDDRARRDLASASGLTAAEAASRQLEKARKMIQPLAVQADE